VITGWPSPIPWGSDHSPPISISADCGSGGREIFHSLKHITQGHPVVSAHSLKRGQVGHPSDGVTPVTIDRLNHAEGLKHQRMMLVIGNGRRRRKTSRHNAHPFSPCGQWLEVRAPAEMNAKLRGLTLTHHNDPILRIECSEGLKALNKIRGISHTGKPLYLIGARTLDQKAVEEICRLALYENHHACCVVHFVSPLFPHHLYIPYPVR
tara:strand:- start:2771 stop:3397 length:627 start_codon:yes stop_codon:yes gene_type:complete